MSIPRRRLLRFAAGAAALPALSRIALAEAYPTRPVRIIAGFPPGGGVDAMARLIAQPLSERHSQQFAVFNRPGAGGNIGTEEVVHAAPNGYTLLLSSNVNAVNATLYEKLNYNFIRDITPVATVSRVPNVVTVLPSFPAKTVTEFIAYAKANPGKVNMASAGNGSSGHVSGELFKMMTGVNLVHVPYRGTPQALTDLMAGQVQVMFQAIPTTIQFVKAGKLRALAVTTAMRLDAMPDVPAVAEFVPGYEASTWYGLCAPKGTPAEIVEKLNKEVNSVLPTPNLKARLAALGAEPLSMTPAEFKQLVVDETEKWGKVVKAAGIKAD